jgi:hypothetical protein
VSYQVIRLVLALAALPAPLAQVLLVRPSRRLQAPLPAWVTWGQSLALVVLYAGIIIGSVEVLAWHRTTPSVAGQLLLFGALGGLGVFRYKLVAATWRQRYPHPPRASPAAAARPTPTVPRKEP